MATEPTPALTVSTMSTPIGPLTIVAADACAVAGGFTEDVSLLTRSLGSALRARQIERAADLGPIGEMLSAYFAGDVHALERIVVSFAGGPFQERVWGALRALPPGRTTTYRDLAVSLGGEGLARAVGRANATNPIAPIVPCHRLTGSDGSLTGYYWGLERKRWLLDHERRHAGAP